jgi:hypothetical protein
MRGWLGNVSHRLAAKTLIFLALLGALWWNQERGVRHLAEETHASLCAFKTDLQIRHDAGKDYVAAVESGERLIIPTFTLADLKRSLAGQRATLRSLSDLSCE